MAPEAAGSGHGDLDYFVFAQFADALLHDVAPEVDVYTAVETAAPAILAAKSIAEDNAPQDVPRFRPGTEREAGEAPAGVVGGSLKKGFGQKPAAPSTGVVELTAGAATAVPPEGK